MGLTNFEKAAIAELRKLRAALLRYGGHLPGCDSRSIDFDSDEPDARMIHGKCDCGFESLKSKLEAAQ